MTAHSPIVLLGDISAETLVKVRDYLTSPRRGQHQHLVPAEPLRPALPAATVTPGLLDIVALRASHFAHGHTVEADLSAKRPGQLAKWGRDYLIDALDLLQRGDAERPRARAKLARAAALLLAELDRLDAQDSVETLPTHSEESA